MAERTANQRQVDEANAKDHAGKSQVTDGRQPHGHKPSGK
jgi:hypothetical protein